MAHILLLAAERFTASDWSRALTETGYTPRVAATATAALAWLEAFQFDLVLVEHAPEQGLDGLAFALQAAPPLRASRACPRAHRGRGREDRPGDHARSRSASTASF
ncbi:MAG: hypothetical protein R3A52_29495 [Polyangiales bacterium]